MKTKRSLIRSKITKRNNRIDEIFLFDL